jgi:hypothetical protein
MQPSSFPVELDIKSLFPHSESQVELPIIDCPVGTVPILRNNRSCTLATHNIVGESNTDRQREVSFV